MPKVLILATAATAKTIMQKLASHQEYKVSAIIDPQEYAPELSAQYKVDFILTSHAALADLLQKQQTDETLPRQQVKAITHQGIRLVPVANIYYFQAEHKYVIVQHTQGELLIEDSLNSLEREFSTEFIRIHRKTLVAKHKIEKLFKNEAGKYYIKLQGRNDTLLVSRRQLANLRKVLINL